MTETSNVVNGSATVSINTSGMEDGIYKVLTEYLQEYDYKGSSYVSNLFLESVPEWTIVDCTDTSNFTAERGTLATHNGYVTCHNNGLVSAHMPLSKNMTIQGTASFTSTNGGVPIVYSNFNAYIFFGRWDNNRLMDSHGSIVERSINTMNINTGLEFEYTIDTNGYITYKDNYGVNETSSTPYTDNQLSAMTLRIIQWDTSQYLDITSLKYKLNNGGGGNLSFFSIVNPCGVVA